MLTCIRAEKLSNWRMMGCGTELGAIRPGRKTRSWRRKRRAISSVSAACMCVEGYIKRMRGKRKCTEVKQENCLVTKNWRRQRGQMECVALGTYFCLSYPPTHLSSVITRQWLTSSWKSFVYFHVVLVNYPQVSPSHKYVGPCYKTSN